MMLSNNVGQGQQFNDTRTLTRSTQKLSILLENSQEKPEDKLVNKGTLAETIQNPRLQSQIQTAHAETLMTDAQSDSKKPPNTLSEQQVGSLDSETIAYSTASQSILGTTIWLLAASVFLALIAKAALNYFHYHPFTKFEKSSLGKKLKYKVNKWLKEWDTTITSEIPNRSPEITEKPMKDAIYSYQIQERRKLYRILDLVLLIGGIRHIPPECACGKDRTNPPVMIDESKIEVKETLMKDNDGNERKEVSAILEHPYNKACLDSWKSYFTELCNLTRHDDVLNWQKFHYVMVIFGVILTGFVLSFNGQPSSISGKMARLLLSLTGIAVSLIADRTFQEGLRCLRGHRRKLIKLEEKGINNSDFLFGNSPFNQRDGLEMGPAIIFIISLLMLIISIF